MKVKVDKENITVTLPISKRSSRSGKTIVVASTNGNKPSEVRIDGQIVYVGFNAYIHRA